MNYDLLRKYAERNIEANMHDGIEPIMLLIEDLIECDFRPHEITRLLGMMSLIFAHVATSGEEHNKNYGNSLLWFLECDIDNYKKERFKVPFEVIENDSKEPSNKKDA